MKSKYMGMRSGSWTCTHTDVARVQPAYKTVNDKRVRCTSAGHRQYYYIFERPTSDGKAMKMIRLSAAQALMVLKGCKTVEWYSKRKEKLRSQEFIQKVSYSFVD